VAEVAEAVEVTAVVEVDTEAIDHLLKEKTEEEVIGNRENRLKKMRMTTITQSQYTTRAREQTKRKTSHLIMKTTLSSDHDL
jgi:hypothetical protein